MIWKIALPLTGILALLIMLSMAKESREFPENVAVLIENSCQGCHSTDSKNVEAKEDLDFQKWDEYKLTKQISLLNDICKMVEEIESGSMPLKSYLLIQKDALLSTEQISLVCDWIEAEASQTQYRYQSG